MNELTLLRSIDDDVAGPTDAAVERTRRLLAEAVLAESAARLPHRRRRRPVWALGVPLVAALTVVLVALNLSGGVTVPGLPPAVPPSASAAEILVQTAARSETAADPVVGAGQYLRVTTDADHVYTNVVRGSVGTDHTARWGWIERTETQLYIPADRADEWVWSTDSTPETPGGEVVESWGADAAQGREDLIRFIWDQTPDEKIWRFHGGVLQTAAIDGEPLSPRLAQASSMPSQPAALLDWYRQQVAAQTWGPVGDAGVFALMTADLRWNLFAAEQRGEIWRAMAELPGIVVSHRGTSASGDPTVTIGLPSAAPVTADDAIDDPELAGLREITIDTDSGTLLASRVFVPPPLTADGTPLYPESTPWLTETFRTEVVDAAP